MRSLILGATGQIGSQLAAECEHHDHVMQGTWYRWPKGEYLPLDICDEDAVHSLVEEFQPETVFLTAGMTQLDYAESKPEECRAVNVGGVQQVIRALAKTDATLVYISSSQIFGECNTARKEDAKAGALNVYGTTCIEAERMIREEMPNSHLIIRTMNVYGPEERGRNFLAHAMKRLNKGTNVRAAVDRFCQPTYGPDLAAATLDLLKHGCRGTYHIVGPDRMTEFAVLQMAAFIFGLDAELIEGTEAAQLGEEAPRARSPWLDRAKLRSELGPNTVRSLSTGLRVLRDGERVAVPRAA